MSPDERREYVDLDAALARVRGNKTIYLKMLGMFEASAEFAAMEESLAAGDYEKGAQVAHGIKGMTANLGLDKLAQAATELMVQMRAGAPELPAVDAYREALEKTRQAVQEIKGELA